MSFWRFARWSGLAGAIACLLPGLRIQIGGYIGAGATQQSFDFSRDINLAWGSFPLSTLFLVGSLAVTALAIAGERGGDRGVLLASIFAVAAIATFLMGVVNESGPLDGWNPVPANSRHGCEVLAASDEPGPGPDQTRCGGYLLDPAISDLQRESAQRDPRLVVLTGYALQPLIGWLVLQPLALLLSYASAYQLLRLGLAPLWSLLMLVGATGLIFLLVAIQMVANSA